MSAYGSEETRLNERMAARAKKIERAKSGRKRNGILLVVSLMLIVGLAAAGTTAWLVSGTDPVNNAFTPSKVTCEVQESFSDGVKTNVTVKIIGDTAAYIRVRLVTYRQNTAGQTIGGAAPLDPALTPGTNWIKVGDYYYYTLPVAADAVTPDALISSYTLQTYTDADGGSQVLEVLAEAIQSTPITAINDAWGGGWTADNAGKLSHP